MCIVDIIYSSITSLGNIMVPAGANANNDNDNDYLYYQITTNGYGTTVTCTIQGL